MKIKLKSFIKPFIMCVLAIATVFQALTVYAMTPEVKYLLPGAAVSASDFYVEGRGATGSERSFDGFYKPTLMFSEREHTACELNTIIFEALKAEPSKDAKARAEFKALCVLLGKQKHLTLHVACRYGFDGVVKDIIERFLTKHASIIGDPEELMTMLDTLLKTPIEILGYDDDEVSGTPLVLACQSLAGLDTVFDEIEHSDVREERERMNIVRSLCTVPDSDSAHKYMCDKHGRSALHYAAYTNRYELVRLLLEYGLSPETQDMAGKTADALSQDKRISALIVACAERKFAAWQSAYCKKRDTGERRAQKVLVAPIGDATPTDHKRRIVGSRVVTMGGKISSK